MASDHAALLPPMTRTGYNAGSQLLTAPRKFCASRPSSRTFAESAELVSVSKATARSAVWLPPGAQLFSRRCNNIPASGSTSKRVASSHCEQSTPPEPMGNSTAAAYSMPLREPMEASERKLPRAGIASALVTSR